MNALKALAREIAKILKEENGTKKTQPYDTQAIVKRIENGTAWVSIPGGVDETPVKLTINAEEGDTVQVRVSGGRAWITGNGTNPPTDDTRANQAYNIADSAIVDAQRAKNAADNAEASAADAKATADAVHDIAVEAKQDAEDAEEAAGEAKQSAENASEYAARALGNLSTVQSVTETLNWITAHGTMTLTTDTALDPTHVYFVRDNNGDYEVGNYHYSVVTEPDVADISTYYVLSIDESLNNYVGTHLAVTSEGLWILPEGMSTSSHKILIATGGQGHTYETAGTYIIDSAGNAVAKFTTSGAVIGIDKNGNSYSVIGADGMQTYRKNNNTSEQIVNLGYGLGTKPDGTQGLAPYVTLGRRKANAAVGNYSVAEGIDIEASGYSSHAEGSITTASGYLSHAEGDTTEASGQGSHAEGGYTTASGLRSHAEGRGTEASGQNSHAEGGYTTASGDQSHAEGKDTTASDARAHAEGYNTTASGENSHAEGYNTTASGENSHTEGYNTTASGENSHTEGIGTTASGLRSHAEGVGTEASGQGSHAEGEYTTASGVGAHAEGIGTTASGQSSHAQNGATIAAKNHQTAIGKFNIEDTETQVAKQKALIIGNGTEQNRSNALTVDWQGNVWTAGTVTENNGTRDISLNISEATITKYVNLGMSLT